MLPNKTNRPRGRRCAGRLKMITIYDDITNPFGVSGAEGYGPGKHKGHEFISSYHFSKITEAANKIGWVSGYGLNSAEGHMSCFYGSVVFRALDGTFRIFIIRQTNTLRSR